MKPCCKATQEEYSRWQDPSEGVQVICPICGQVWYVQMNRDWPYLPGSRSVPGSSRTQAPGYWGQYVPKAMWFPDYLYPVDNDDIFLWMMQQITDEELIRRNKK